MVMLFPIIYFENKLLNPSESGSTAIKYFDDNVYLCNLSYSSVALNQRRKGNRICFQLVVAG